MLNINYKYNIYGEIINCLKMTEIQQSSIPSFPKDFQQENEERTQLTVRVTNDTACYPRRVDNLSARYFFDISEMVAKKQSIKDLNLAVMYDEALTVDGKATKVNGPYAWDEENNIYYVEL